MTQIANNFDVHVDIYHQLNTPEMVAMVEMMRSRLTQLHSSPSAASRPVVMKEEQAPKEFSIRSYRAEVY